MIDNRSPLPDIEKVLVGWLKADPYVTAIVPASKISTELPANAAAEARIQLFRSTGSTEDKGTETIDRAIAQFNAFGRNKGEAFQVAARIVGSVKALEGELVDTVAVSLTERITGPGWSPDPATNIPRYLMTFGITAH